LKPTNNPSEQIAVYIFGTVAILFIFIVVGVVAATVAAVALIVWAIRKYFFTPPPPAPLENLYADTLRQISAVPTEDDVVENVLLKLLDKHQLILLPRRFGRQSLPLQVISLAPKASAKSLFRRPIRMMWIERDIEIRR